MYLGEIAESSILFIPKRDRRGVKEMMLDLMPSVLSLWIVGISVLYTYPRSVRAFRYVLPNVKSFAIIHAVRDK